MKRFALISILISCFSAFAFAQAETLLCPEIKVTAPSGVVMSGEPMNFSISVGEESEKRNYEYQWSVDVGEIIAGQDTKAIQVATEGLENITLTATVTIKGLPKTCNNKASDTGVVSAPIGCGMAADEYGKLLLIDEFARFDNLYITLNNNPGFMVYISFEIAKDEKISDVEKRFSELSAFFKRRKYDSNLIIYDVCRSDITSTIMRIVPNGAEIPYTEKCERLNVRLN